MRLPLLWDREATPPPPRMETSPPPKLESSDDTADSNAIVVSVGWCMKRGGRGLRDANGLFGGQANLCFDGENLL